MTAKLSAQPASRFTGNRVVVDATPADGPVTTTPYRKPQRKPKPYMTARTARIQANRRKAAIRKWQRQQDAKSG